MKDVEMLLMFGKSKVYNSMFLYNPQLGFCSQTFSMLDEI
jgi:hypothetical protein